MSQSICLETETDETAQSLKPLELRRKFCRVAVQTRFCANHYARQLEALQEHEDKE